MIHKTINLDRLGHPTDLNGNALVPSVDPLRIWSTRHHGHESITCCPQDGVDRRVLKRTLGTMDRHHTRSMHLMGNDGFESPWKHFVFSMDRLEPLERWRTALWTMDHGPWVWLSEPYIYISALRADCQVKQDTHNTVNRKKKATSQQEDEINRRTKCHRKRGHTLQYNKSTWNGR